MHVRTCDELADTACQIKHALAEVADEGEEAGDEVEDATDEGMNDGVGGTKN